MPKHNIPVIITLDLPAAAEWADIFKAVDEVKKQPTVQTVAPAAAKKLPPMPAAVLARLESAGDRWTRTGALARAVFQSTGKRVDKNSIHQHIYNLRWVYGVTIETSPRFDGGYRLAKEAS